MYHYWGYGLLIESEMEFPELLPFEFEKADLTIRVGKTPETLLGDDVVRRVRVQISPTEYLLRFVDIVNYYAAHGNEIIIEPLPGADEKTVRLFTLSNAFAAILYQRGQIPFHASAIEVNGGLAMFCGESGAGKSTTLSLLRQQGYAVFSDDVCVLCPSATQSKAVDVLSSYPMIKLWENSFALLQLEDAITETRIRPELPKHSLFFHEQFNTSAASVHSIFVLNPDRQATEVKIEALNNMEAFVEIQKHVYRPLQLNAMKMRKTNLQLLSQLVAGAKVYKLTRPEKGNFTKEVLTAIEQCLKSRN